MAIPPGIAAGAAAYLALRDDGANVVFRAIGVAPSTPTPRSTARTFAPVTFATDNAL
jgi:hypothetical protein